ncbi:MAG: adenylate cyclase [Chloroflexota bacterium]|nr:adenylate cyclase [Chloroflexota bacterium]
MTAANTGLIAAHFVRARWRWATLRGPVLHRYQERHARRIVAYTQQHSPFYRAHWAGHDPHRWRSLPPVDKRLMMEHFDGFNTVGIGREAAMALALRAEQERDFTPTLGSYTVGLSSGTSGHRGLFVASAWEQAAWAGTILARTIHRLGRRLRVAFFLRSNSNLYEQVGGALVQFRFFDLMTPLDRAVAALNGFAPHVIVGPASLLALLAAARQRGTLRARPRRLIAVAEVLEPHDRARLESVFGVRVEQIYQCTEGLLAISCAAGSLHIQEDLVALQLAPLPGDAGRVTPIVTDLWRRTQPIIRYRLNDVLQMDPRPCRCGSSFRVIRAIEGRCDDLCLFPAADGSLRPFFADTIRRMILLAHAAITDYQAVQEQPGHLRVHLDLAPAVPFDDVAAALRASVDATVAGYGCRPAQLEIEPGLPPPVRGAKRRRVVRVVG